MYPQGKFVEPIHTASSKQKSFGDMTAEEVAATDWIGLERKRTKMDQNIQVSSIGPGRTERPLQQPKVSLEDQENLDLATLRGCKMALERESHISANCRRRVEAMCTPWLSYIRDKCISRALAKGPNSKKKSGSHFDPAWYRPIYGKFIDNLPLAKPGDWVKVRSISEGNSSQIPAYCFKVEDWEK